tara:strand:- start:90 stop:365 length:276 start_codon:yes stop_codon:yes gene_type:complete
MSEVLSVCVSVIQPDGTKTENIYGVDFVPAASDLLNDPSVQEGVEGIQINGSACMVWSSPEGEPNPQASNFAAGQPIYGPAVVFSVWGVSA